MRNNLSACLILYYFLREKELCAPFLFNSVVSYLPLGFSGKMLLKSITGMIRSFLTLPQAFFPGRHRFFLPRMTTLRDKNPSTDESDNDADVPAADEDRLQLRVSVNDADGNVPIELARVALSKDGRYIADAVTNPAGQARFRDIKAGSTASLPGLWDMTRSSIPLWSTENIRPTRSLHSLGTAEKEVVVVGQRDPTTSNYQPGYREPGV